MPRRPLRAAGALIAASALVLTACTAGSDEPAPTSTAAADPDASVAIRLVLEPGNLDIRQTAGAALDQILIDNVYQGLVSRTADQEIVPALASDYEISEDGLTYTFELREGVSFHDGQELTPEDVVWSLETRRDTPEWRDSGRLANIESVSAEGQTITLTLSEPDSTLLWNLTGRAGIVLKEGDEVDYQTEANGTGPFVLDDWLQGDSITLVRNDTYWGEPAGVAEVYFDYIPDNQAALNAALAGEVDVVTGFDATLGEQIEANGDFALVLGESTDKGTLAFNQTEGSPLADQRVRQAIRQAIDHDAFIEAAQSGQTLYGPIPALDPGYEDLSGLAPYDPEVARQLLADADAEDLELTLTIPNFYPTTVAQILVSNLNEVGITLEVESVDFPTWLNDVYTNHDYDLSFVLHTEAHDFENWADPDYYFTYDNPEVQELYAQSVAATDPAEAEQLLAEAARIVSEDAAADWLYNGASVLAVGTNISHMPSTNVNERLNLAEITKSEG
ncbi:ABC transporter substrate-binding protein [Microbacterium aquimaris]|uniref:ABC transporter substrate-binding protein n=1 Tax=Microbacterium aquimaris TaxID=459816 RepID=A0ABU5N6R3_9MICO|nr:ABC transporter substrate-binding protein [Microbacterium aquimaris]MDZ8161622.1 ABC transporter substrate-binding protein [Microbacterium aquimaris]